MKTITSFSHKVRVIANEWIPLSTGERLAARLWLPEGAEVEPVPAIVEYIPYRKGDYSAARDQMMHGYFAGHGYAALRVDVRGTGDSDGVHTEQWADAYDNDAKDLFRWIAAQPWCNGRIGMIGLSWGGQTGLRMAGLAPPELKAVIVASAADDRYTNKYLGGCLLLNSVVWASTVTAQNSRPPDPANVGEPWRDMWLNRLDNLIRYIENWVGHQTRDDYWESGSVVPLFGKFGCPVYAVGGAADPGYAVTVPRLLKNLTVPVKGIIGPWAHKYPHLAMPGPAIGFLQEALRWFDRWLGERENGIEREPALRAFMHEFMVPKGYLPEKSGRWVQEPRWPAAGIESRKMVLNPTGLGGDVAAERGVLIDSPQSVGLAAGEWMPWLAFGEQAELPLDQRGDDERSVTFDSEPLGERLEILGLPSLTLELASDKPVAMVVARLCDVAPDGTSVRVAYGALNMTRRDSLERPQPLEPGRRYRVNLPLYFAAHGFQAGHRIRVALSTSYWPIIWPMPEAATVTLYTGVSSLLLPVRPQRPEDDAGSPFGEPEAAMPLARTILREPHMEREVTHDPATGEAKLRHLDDGGVYRLDDTGMECGARTERLLTIRDDDPTSARVEVEWHWTFRRKEWSTRTEVRGSMWCTRETFEFQGSVAAFEGEDRAYQREWRNSIPRHLI
ncbi:MAG: CocE/NonD family hydrolase [SAR324 cluster bacterium]|nr:CocE/NonD family hydrolase [SAR324 cluster bacterium]